MSETNLPKTPTKEKLIFWELNEINFDYVNFYIREGKLKNWKKLIEDHGLFTTFSEENYNELQPWIQWPTIRTGLNYEEHGVHRIGDIIESGVKQHWEILEDKGFNVAAISPINASNNTKKSTFWIPDPWTDTQISGNGFVKRFSKAFKQVVNDNSSEKMSFFSVAVICEALITKSQVSSWRTYMSCFFGAVKKQHWSKAIFLDRLLADILISLWKKNKPDFSSLWLNGGAHIQHHYLCSSKAYTGSVKNPEWYVPNGKDPLLEILEMYDLFLKEIQNLKNIRLIIAVAIKQIPYENPIFYWRLKNHDDFLKKIGIKFKRIQPRMSIDFLVEFESEKDLIFAEEKLLNVKSNQGDLIFSEVNRVKEGLFVSLTFTGEIKGDFHIFLNGEKFENFENDVFFVAIKNGHHDGLGYYLDTSKKPGELQANMPLKNIFHLVLDHFHK
jgi:hypothetical protein